MSLLHENADIKTKEQHRSKCPKCGAVDVIVVTDWNAHPKMKCYTCLWDSKTGEKGKNNLNLGPQ